jgi:hypothetical protein
MVDAVALRQFASPQVVSMHVPATVCDQIQSSWLHMRSSAGIQGRVFLDTPGTCAASSAVLAKEAVLSSLVPPDNAEAVVNLRMWPTSISVDQGTYGYMEFRSVELALSSGVLATLIPEPGQPNVLARVCPHKTFQSHVRSLIRT